MDLTSAQRFCRADTLTTKKATANPTTATAIIPAPIPPTIAPAPTPESEESEDDEALGTVEEIERLTAVSGVSPIATLLLLAELTVELGVALMVELMAELRIELMAELTVETYPSCPSAQISRVFSK